MTTDWDFGPGKERPACRLLRTTLLFGAAAIAGSLALATFAERQAQYRLVELETDPMPTGSVRTPVRIYTIHRSVLQPSRDAVCIIELGGRRRGEC